jgi:hypothetical protein
MMLFFFLVIWSQSFVVRVSERVFENGVARTAITGTSLCVAKNIAVMHAPLSKTHLLTW